MKRLLPILFTLLALAACSGKKGEMRITGEITGLEEADLFVFSTDGGSEGIDTIHIHDGQFDWRTPCSQDAATYQIVWPSFSTLTVFGGSGQVAEIKGDAHSLGKVTVDGSEDNRQYTQIRLIQDSLPENQADSIINAYTIANPQSQLTRFLAKQKAANSVPPTLQVGQKMPSYTLKMLSGKTLGSLGLRGRYVLFAFWASWMGGQMEVTTHLREAQNNFSASSQQASQSSGANGSETLKQSETDKRSLNRASGAMVCISYILDVNRQQLNYLPHSASDRYETFCDQLAFQSPLVSRLGIRQLPYYILVGKDGRIIASSASWAEVREKL